MTVFLFADNILYWYWAAPRLKAALYVKSGSIRSNKIQAHQFKSNGTHFYFIQWPLGGTLSPNPKIILTIKSQMFVSAEL